MTPATASALAQLASRFGTPSYVYFIEPMRRRIEHLREAFGDRFTVSYAVKANPNVALLRALRAALTAVDASSAGEIARAIRAGFAPAGIAFSGPAKRRFEIDYALQAETGVVVCESETEVVDVDAAATSHARVQPILLRVNPRRVPRRFGLQMGGRASQFGIDEERISGTIDSIAGRCGVALHGLHVFSAGNSLDESAVAENFSIMTELFAALVRRHSLLPRKLVFGSGFGIPYFDEDHELDLDRLAASINPLIDELRSQPGLAECRFMLEMGRWIVGGDGYLLTSVVDTKDSRGVSIRLCDAGFNNHLSACGMMGTVMKRNWRFTNLARPDATGTQRCLLVGPLCASFDVLGSDVMLPQTERGDVLAVASSGAYGLTASPTRFISHPEPREVLVERLDGLVASDVTESTMHRDTGIDAR